MRGYDEMVTSHMGNKSVGWSQLARPAGYISVSEGAKDPYAGVHYHPHLGLCYTEKELEEEKAERNQDPLSSWDNEELRNMFFDWARKEGKIYGSLEESKLRFKVWCATKKMTEQHCSNTGQTFSIDKMNMFSDQTSLESTQLCGFIPAEVSFNGSTPPEYQRLLDNLGSRGVNEAWNEFNSWAYRHRRDYGGNIRERNKRFLAYLDNKRKIDLIEEFNPGLWKYGYDADTMDKFEWEASLYPESAPSPRCSGW